MNDKLSQTELQAIQAVFSGGNTNASDSTDKLSTVLEGIFCDRLGYKVDFYFIDSEILDNDIESIELTISHPVNRELLSKEYSRKSYASDAEATSLEKHIFSKIQNNVSKEISKASALLANLEGQDSATLYRFNFEDQVVKLSVPANYFKSQSAGLSIVAPVVEIKRSTSATASLNTSLAEKINANLAIYFKESLLNDLTDEGVVSLDIESLNFEIFNSRESLKVSTYAYVEGINLGAMAKQSYEIFSTHSFDLVVNGAHIETGFFTVSGSKITLSLSSQQEKKGA